MRSWPDPVSAIHLFLAFSAGAQSESESLSASEVFDSGTDVSSSEIPDSGTDGKVRMPSDFERLSALELACLWAALDFNSHELSVTMARLCTFGL
jgi:hypothetical protein